MFCPSVTVCSLVMSSKREDTISLGPVESSSPGGTQTHQQALNGGLKHSNYCPHSPLASFFHKHIYNFCSAFNSSQIFGIFSTLALMLSMKDIFLTSALLLGFKIKSALTLFCLGPYGARETSIGTRTTANYFCTINISATRLQNFLPHPRH